MNDLNPNQQDIQHMFELLNNKNISSIKYEKHLQDISNYAENVGEYQFFRGLIIKQLTNK